MSEQQVDAGTALASSVAVELRVLIGNLRRRMRQGALPGDFTTPQMAALARLEREGPVTVTALAKAEGVRPQTMGANVSVLQAAGLVSGVPDPSDGRQTILSITDKAREEIAAGRAARQDWLLRAIRTHLTPTEQEQVATAVELLKRLVDS